MKKMMLGLMVVLSVFLVMPVMPVVPVGAISETQKTAIVERCDTIKNTLKTVQHVDSRTRVYLGRHYETIWSKYITPLNVRLVENNMPDSGLLTNQDSFAKARGAFAADFIEYQKSLEELVGIDCKAEPSRFYEVLITARSKRKIVAGDVTALRKLAIGQKNLVMKLKERP